MNHIRSGPAVAGHVDSYYAATAKNIHVFPELQDTVDADVCVIGGGYTGLSAAYHLAARNYRVVLLEAERVGWGASGRNGGQASTGQRQGQTVLEHKLGKPHARQLWNLGLEAVDLVKNLVSEFAIDCDLKHGALSVAGKASHAEEMQHYVDKLRNEYDYDKVSFIPGNEIRDMVGSNRFYGGQLDTGAVHLHPLNYALGLAHAAQNSGALIFEQSRAVRYNNTTPTTIETSRGRVTAQYLILACNGYLGRLEPRIAGRIMPINNFVLATEPLGRAGAKALIRDDVCVHDSFFVINYWKLSGDDRLIFGGGENYTTRFPSDIRQFVRKYMLRIYPQLENTRIDYGWGGTLAITINRMPDFGRLEPNVFYAQGYSGHGVPLATLAGKLLTEVICGTAERFDVMAKVPIRTFPGGTLLRWPGLVAGMLWHSMLDKL